MNSKITPEILRGMKGVKSIAALTTYDYPMTRLLDEAGIPLLLVGDSLGMVVLGYPDTTHVTLADILHHLRAAARAKPRGLLGADLPYKSYETPVQALESARCLTAEGAEFIKMEGGIEIIPQIDALKDAGIAVCGHLGMLPQHIREEGRYRIKGRDPAGRSHLLADANALVTAGAFAIVLELVVPTVAEEITRTIPLPTIGIGSGPTCDGQILVTHDLIGGFPWFTPRFVKPEASISVAIVRAAALWRERLETPVRI